MVTKTETNGGRIGLLGMCLYVWVWDGKWKGEGEEKLNEAMLKIKC